MQRIGHPALIVLVRTWGGQGNGPERQSRSFALRFEQFAPYAVHGDPIESLIDRSQEAEDYIFLRLLSERVQGPGAVFAAAPGNDDAFGCSVCSQGKIVPSI